MKFNNLYKILLEKTFNYKVPKDSEKLLYDFYMMEFIKSIDLDSVKQDDMTIYSFKEANKDLVKYLKEHMLEALMFAMAAEFRHVFDSNSNKKLKTFLRKKTFILFVQLFKTLLKKKNFHNF